MNQSLLLGLALLAFVCAAPTATAQSSSTMAPSATTPAAANCATCGAIESIRYVEEKGTGSGVGAVAGGVVGGVVGHQFGSGRGNTVATIAGAGVGALAGNEVEKNVKKKSYYVITVRLDNGNKQSVSQTAKPALKQGDRVKVVDGNRVALLAK
ncbi:MAG TPA: glycine zipper 2TM domain-containing protein [Casimicrobiaceae bacterium]|nr:glycine zipper 2TM domain-containing protein [Casimicrobiaceae bacterium]